MVFIPIRRSLLPRHTAIDPPRLLLWTPFLAALAGLVILVLLHLTTPLYLSILVFIIAYAGLALFGSGPLQAALVTHAALSYAGVLLLTWWGALYLLPDHPATAMVRLAVVLYLTTVYVFLFVQHPPQTATVWSVGVLLALLLITLPHAGQTLGQTGAFDGVTLLLTVLLSHGALIAVLRAFSTVRDQLAQAEGRAQALHELAHQDPLTGLANRRALERDLARAVEEPGIEWHLAVVDVDGLKKANDLLGHAAGDDLLRRFAQGFEEAVGTHGRVYRISGDEYAILLEDGQVAVEAVVALVTDEVRTMYPEASASVGATRWQMGESADAWLSRADRAMYQHKRRVVER